METELFKVNPSTIGNVKYLVIRIVALAAVAFSIYDYEENIVFFSIFMAVSALFFLFTGPSQIIINHDSISIACKSLIKNPLANYTFLFEDLMEITLEIPNELIDMTPHGPTFLPTRSRLVILPLKVSPQAFLLDADSQELLKAVDMANEIIKKKKGGAAKIY